MSTAIPVAVLDGGLGTTLTSAPYSQTFDHSTPLWSSHLLISSPETLGKVHQAFIEAGAEWILTATYQASFDGFRRTRRISHDGDSGKTEGYSEAEAARYMLQGLEIALRAAVHPPARIILSLGPYGATMVPSTEYTGNYEPFMSSQEALHEWHAKRLRVFATGTVEALAGEVRAWDAFDCIAFETLKRPDEIRAVRRVMNDANLRAEKTKKWYTTAVFPDSVQKEEVSTIIEAMLGTSGKGGDEDGLDQPWGVGVNCTGASKVGCIVEIMEDALNKMPDYVNRWGSSSGRPWLVLYPDGAVGLKYDSTKMEWVPAESEDDDHNQSWDELVGQTVKDIADRRRWEGILVGGCCQTGPAEIKALRGRLRLAERPAAVAREASSKNEP